MSEIFLLLLQLYFVAILMTSSIAKLDCIQCFTRTIQKQGVISTQLTPIVGIGIPLIELFLATMLILGYSPHITATIVAALFSSFLLVEFWVYLTGDSKQCGCYGNFHNQKIEPASLIVSLLLMLFALLNLWLIISGVTIIGGFLRTSVIIIYGVTIFGLFLKLLERKKNESRMQRSLFTQNLI